LTKFEIYVILIIEGDKMQIIREVRKINSDRIEIAVPKEFREREVEILVLPLDSFKKKVHQKKKLHLTQYECYGKKEDFSRADAYDDRL
jgi:hypothetical protein